MMHHVMLALTQWFHQHSKYPPFSDFPWINIQDINKYLVSEIWVPVSPGAGPNLKRIEWIRINYLRKYLDLQWIELNLFQQQQQHRYRIVGSIQMCKKQEFINCWWNGECRKLKDTYVDVFPVEITLVNYSYNVTITYIIIVYEQSRFNINFSIKYWSEFQNLYRVWRLYLNANKKWNKTKCGRPYDTLIKTYRGLICRPNDYGTLAAPYLPHISFFETCESPPPPVDSDAFPTIEVYDTWTTIAQTLLYLQLVSRIRKLIMKLKP